jgi:hypothetical protein
VTYDDDKQWVEYHDTAKDTGGPTNNPLKVEVVVLSFSILPYSSIPFKSSMNRSMMLSKAAVSLLVWSSVVSAWAPRHMLSHARHVRYSGGRILATQLHSSTLSAISTEVIGTEQTESFRLSFKESAKSISPWHDIPFKNADGTYNMVRQITSPSFRWHAAELIFCLYLCIENDRSWKSPK